MQSEKLDFLELLHQREARNKKAAELEQQYNVEASIIEEKYVQVLSEYRPALDVLNLKIKMFDATWKPLMADYRKELKILRRKYNQKLKAL